MIPVNERPLRQRYLSALVLFLYACATLQFIRFYCKSTVFYLHVNAYLAGTERLPFQERVLPAFLMGSIQHSRWFPKLAHNNGILTPDMGAFYLLSLISFVVAGIYAQKLYNVITENRTLPLLVYPVFLFTVMWTYCIHLEADYSYPYDMMSLAFFTAGLYYIYLRKYVPLLLVVLVGTWNRETTLFLVGLYILDGASVRGVLPLAQLSARFNFRLVRWSRVALLAFVWVAIEFLLAHRFEHNDRSEDYIRFSENFRRLQPRLLPALLNICGYALPLVLLFRRSLRPVRFANYLWIVPFWVAVMFYTGVILETRIYGELCSFSAVAIVLILEQNVQATMTADAIPVRTETRVPAEVTA